jgi:glycosyltransferase involved in cell wall biosynthesis
MATEYAYPVLGGMPEHVHNLSKEMAARGHDVTVLTSMPPGMRRMARRTDAENLALHGYRTLRIGLSMPIVSNGSFARISAGIGAKPRIARALEGMDVVHAQGLAVPTICLWAIRVSRAPVNVGTFHTYFEGGHWGYKYFFAYVRSTIARTDRLIAVSDACLTALRPYFRDQAFDVIPNGVDTELYRPLEPGEERPPGPPRILFVGRFDTRNRLDILLQAARILQDEGRDFVVQVVGDGPLRPMYHRQARSLGVWDRIRWLGLLDRERPRLYREATVFAAPCILASFGVVLLEAMASGTPIVCADNVGFRQVIRDGAPGRFVPPGDAGALAAGIAEQLDDADRRRDWGERGRAVAVERYSWPEVARRVEELYLEILASKGGRPDDRPPVGLRFNLRRNPIELVRNVPSALRSGYAKERVPGD